MEVPYHEAPDATAGVQCSVEGCDAVFNTADPATHGAFTTHCGHSLCGTCADVLVRDADLSPRCPLCFVCKPTVRANPGLSKQGDMVLAKARACTVEGLAGNSMQPDAVDAGDIRLQLSNCGTHGLALDMLSALTVARCCAPSARSLTTKVTR